MKKIMITVFGFLTAVSVWAADLPQWASPLAYEKFGSCSDGTLGYNASRFTKIDLHKTRDDFDLYLQLIIYLKNDGTAYLRTQEVGMAQCNSTPDGDECIYWPFPDTKKILVTTWDETGDSISIANVGQLTKVRDNFPWLGYQIKTSDTFSIVEARGEQSIGGKVQVNFNEYGVNSVFICKSNKELTDK